MNFKEFFITIYIYFFILAQKSHFLHQYFVLKEGLRLIYAILGHGPKSVRGLVFEFVVTFGGQENSACFG